MLAIHYKESPISPKNHKIQFAQVLSLYPYNIKEHNCFHHTFFLPIIIMKLQFILLAVLPIAFAADCLCPQVKCPGDEPAVRIPHYSCVPVANLLTLSKLCKCLNSAALACYKKCGGPPPHLKVLPWSIFTLLSLRTRKLTVHYRNALSQPAAQPVWHLHPLQLYAAAAAFLLALTAPSVSMTPASQAAISQLTALASASYQARQPL